jgi:hypothetical protein
MDCQHRRDFLANVGRGMLVAGLGPTLAHELGLARAYADDEPKRLNFGELESLVCFLQETPKDRLLPQLVEKLQSGLSLRQLTAAAALANARTFGGEDYFGFHVFMALTPAYQMALELPKPEQPLPLLKVLYRNAHYTQAIGGANADTLRPVDPVEAPKQGAAELLRAATNRGDKASADGLLATLERASLDDAFNAVLLGVQDNHEVHSVVLPWRAWTMLDFVGRENALTLLRQSIHKCAKQSAERKTDPQELARIRAKAPGLLDKHGLLARPLGSRPADDGWIQQLSDTILASSEDQAGEAVAAALAEGFAPEQVGEAISVAANELVLRQVENWANGYGRRVHGDSPGVHASDTVNAWRNMVRVSNQRNQAAGLILAAMNVAYSHMPTGDARRRAHDEEPYPRREHLDAVTSVQRDDLLKQLDGAIRENDQFRAAALVQRSGELGCPARPLLDALLQYAVSEDGRLHAEKYYRTVVEEFATTRPAFRWRQLVALARVTASAFGYSQADKKDGRAPGYDEARRLLKI